MNSKSCRMRLSLLAMATAAAMVPAGIAQAQETELLPFATAPVAEAELGVIAGREDLNQLSQSQQVASVSSNSVSGTSNTGGIAIDGSAFQNLSGLMVLNANTGNNVAINASMNVNIAINPQP